jgi:hypothetical protein
MVLHKILQNLTKFQDCRKYSKIISATYTESHNFVHSLLLIQKISAAFFLSQIKKILVSQYEIDGERYLKNIAVT